MPIDAHQHFWTYDEARYGWIAEGGLHALKRDFLPDDLRPLLDQRGVDGTVAVQARQDLEESEWLLGLAADHPWIRGVVGWVDLASDEVQGQLDRLAAARGGERLVGIRHVVQAEAEGFLDSADFRRGVAAVGARGLAYDVLILEHQLEEAVRFCGAMSGQRLVLDHLAKPRIAAGELDRWAGLMRELGAMEHVTCKVSGMVTEADHGAWTYDQLTPYMDVAFEAFGPRRLLFGSDWPVCTLAAPYARVHEVFSRWRASLSMVGATVDAEAAVEAAYGLT